MKITESLGNGYSTGSTQRELFNEYQHECLDVFQKSVCPCDLDESSLHFGRVNVEMIFKSNIAAGRVLADIWKQGVQIEVS